MKASGIILSGGLGRRVNGADKGLLTWRDRTLVEAVIGCLQSQVMDIVISANRNLDHYQSLGHVVVSDTLDDFQGPLAGVLAALPVCELDTAIVVPCDSPQLPRQLAQRLLQPLHDDTVDLSYAHDGERAQYLLTAVRVRCLSSLRDYLAEGGRSVRGWHRQLNCAVVDFSDCRAQLLNLNEGQAGKKNPP
jgi:molybdenum cofactor guanylyltransferase